MRAIKVEFLLEDNQDTEHFVTQILPKLKEVYKIKQVFYSSVEYF